MHAEERRLQLATGRETDPRPVANLGRLQTLRLSLREDIAVKLRIHLLPATL